MHNLVAFFKSVAQDAVLDNITPVTDPLVTVTANNRVIFPQDYQVGLKHLSCLAATRARINTPSMRNVCLPEIYPIDVTAAVGTNPPVDGPSWGLLRVPRNDEFGIDVSRGGAGAADCYGAIWVAPAFVSAPPGPVFTMRATCAITLTAGTWVTGNLTFDQTLPFGRYAVVGMHVTLNDGMYARLTFPGQTQFRPGVVVVEAVGDYVNPQIFRYGNMGLFGTFDSTAQPGLECLGDTAGAETAVVLLDLVMQR